MGNYNLEKNAILKQPYGVSDEKFICCGFCKSDPITVDFSVLKQGYAPGECIVFNAYFDNKSNRNLNDVVVDLYQIINFYAVKESTHKEENRKEKKV